MDSRHRYNRDEISNILKRAAELEHKDNIEEDGEGLTLQELQQVSKDVGIDPKYIQQALSELNNPSGSIIPTLLGGPFSYNISDSAEQIVDDEIWEDIVSEIRRIHGGIGKTSKLGNTFEWEQRKREVGYVQVSMSPKKDHTKISINASYRYYASMIYAFTGGFGFLLLTILLEKLGLPFVTQVITTISGTLGLLGIARFYLSNWIRKKRKTYRKLIKRFQEMLSTDDESEKDYSSSIDIPEVDEQEIQKEGISASQQREIPK